jgi:hypothetical protein
MAYIARTQFDYGVVSNKGKRHVDLMFYKLKSASFSKTNRKAGIVPKKYDLLLEIKFVSNCHGTSAYNSGDFSPNIQSLKSQLTKIPKKYSDGPALPDRAYGLVIASYLHCEQLKELNNHPRMKTFDKNHFLQKRVIDLCVKQGLHWQNTREKAPMMAYKRVPI